MQMQVFNYSPVRVRQYYFTCIAGAESAQVVAQTPTRCVLIVQVTGLNPVRLQFGKPVTGVSDFIFYPGAPPYIFTQVPVGSINIRSDYGSTLVIAEGSPADEN